MFGFRSACSDRSVPTNELIPTAPCLWIILTAGHGAVCHTHSPSPSQSTHREGENFFAETGFFRFQGNFDHTQLLSPKESGLDWAEFSAAAAASATARGPEVENLASCCRAGKLQGGRVLQRAGRGNCRAGETQVPNFRREIRVDRSDQKRAATHVIFVALVIPFVATASAVQQLTRPVQQNCESTPPFWCFDKTNAEARLRCLVPEATQQASADKSCSVFRASWVK